MPDDRSIPRGDVAAMVRLVDPEWRVREATLADRGFTAVYHLRVETPTGTRECVLKASHDGEPHGIDVEARLLAILTEHTDVPVPTVLGAVDEHDDLPTPCFIMESLPGTALPYQATARLPDRDLRRLARQTGEHLGQLHSLDAVGCFGPLGVARGPPLEGGRPDGDVGTIRVADASERWPEYLGTAVGEDLDRLTATRFGDLAPRLRPWFRGRIRGLEGPFEPVVGRLDHGLCNLLVDPGTRDVTDVVDWGFALAVPAGYDLQVVEYVLGGAVLSGAPDARDRRPLVRESMRSAYRSTASRPPDLDPRARELYETWAHVRSMIHLEAGIAKIPAGTEDAVADWLRREVASALA